MTQVTDAMNGPETTDTARRCSGRNMGSYDMTHDMTHGAVTGEQGCRPSSGPSQRGSTLAHDDAAAPGSPVGVVVAGFVSMVLLGLLANFAGFGLVASVFIGWVGSILGVLLRVLFAAWVLDREARQAQAAVRGARSAAPFRIVSDAPATRDGYSDPRSQASEASYGSTPGPLAVPQFRGGEGLSVARDVDPMGPDTVSARRYR